jgi:phosphopantetheinyl transferase
MPDALQNEALEIQHAQPRLPLADELLLWRLNPVQHTENFLSTLLSDLLGVHTLRWQRGLHGKPSLSDHALHLNWSHTRGALLLALSHAGPVGVDIEAPRCLSAALLKRCFSEPEQALCAEQPALALQYWCLKEALVKASGRGIAAGLRQLDVSDLSCIDAFVRPFCLDDFAAAVACICDSQRALRLRIIDVRSALAEREKS